MSSMEEPGAERSSSPSGSEDSEGESKHGDTVENGRESEEEQEEHSKGEGEDSSSSDSEGSGEDDSEHSAKSEAGDARNSGGGGEGAEEGQGREYSSGGGGYPMEGEAYPLADLPLEVITTVEPTNYAYPVLKNMSNGVLTHRNIFTEAERSVLVGIINKYRNIVDTRSRTREIYLEKQNVWQQIVEEYNSTENIMVRTEKELRKCWDNMKYRAKQAEKEMFKTEMKAEDDGDPSGIKTEPPDHDTFHFASDYEAVTEEVWQCGEPGGEEEREPALKKARQESPKLSSLLLAAAHKRSPGKKSSKSSGGSASKSSSSISNNSNNFPYSIPSCTKVMHVKKKGQSGAASGSVNVSSQEIPILPKGLASCLSITNIPNPSGVLGNSSQESASPGTSPVQAALKPMPSLKKMVPSKHQHGTAKSSSMRSSRKSNGLSSKARGHTTAPGPEHPPSPVLGEAESEERLLSSRLVTQRLQLEQREHELRMRLLEKELQAHTFQCQYWNLRLKLLRSGREGGGSGGGGALNLAGATNGDID